MSPGFFAGVYMKKIISCSILSLMLFAGGCAGNRKMVKTFSGEPGEIVEAQGVAPIVKGDVLNARKAALADAQKSAVELVVGVYVTGQTRVSKAVTIESSILARTEGYITRYEILKEGKDGEFYTITIKALVKLDEINKDLESLGLLVTPEEAGNPRVSVIIEEVIDGNASESGDAEMAVFQALLDSGYPAVESTNLSEQDVDSVLSGGAAFYRSIGTKLKVEILIIGKVSAGLVTRTGLGGFISYRASANFKAIRCSDGKIMVTASAVQSGVDINTDIAAATALKAAAKTGAEKIAAELASTIKQRSTVALEITGLSSLQDLRALQSFLDKMAEIKSTQLRNYTAGKAEIDLYLQSGSTQDIADHLSKTHRWNVDIQAITAYDLNISVDKKE